MNILRRVIQSSVTPLIRKPLHQPLAPTGGAIFSNMSLSKLTQSLLGRSLISPAVTRTIHTKNTKPQKLHKSLRGGGDNGGLDYGFEIMKAYVVKRRPVKKIYKNPLGDGVPFAKGIVLKTLVKKPKKPNSANRKCVLVRLPSGKEYTAYIPGEGHTLQEHNQVLVKNKRLRDTPGVKLTCVRGKYDLPPVVKKTGP